MINLVFKGEPEGTCSRTIESAQILDSTKQTTEYTVENVGFPKESLGI